MNMRSLSSSRSAYCNQDKMKAVFVGLLSLLVPAVAFQAAVAPKTTSALKATPSELGVTKPLGFWDPLNLAGKGTAEDFERRRAVELKHGRVAMAAFVGYLVPEVFKFPGYLSTSADLKFEDVPNGLNALTVVPGIGWAQIVMVIGWLEIGPYLVSKSEFAGDWGWPYFGRKIQDPEEKAFKLNVELNNGRAAMFGIMGLLMQDAINGEVYIGPFAE
mmetsp:Transcript_9191/g.28204  ORF Transcript_9191/g.28204 Transcript_9191/m.28204 type:complete len:217 (+) Transcript_9191:2-652(+)